ncbi:MAG: peptide deformylase [Patescibacteria group bacterium]
MILPIQKGKNNPILRKKSAPVENTTEEILNLVKNMTETMLKFDGVGLSANQVGKNIRLFVVNQNLIRVGAFALPKPFGRRCAFRMPVFINPEIIKISKKTDLVEEGCLSLPNVYRKIPRAKSLKIKAIDENGKQFKLKAKDMLARVIQHELDHLNGKLIIDYE